MQKQTAAAPLYTLYCRAFQAVMTLGQYVMGYRMPERFEGAGASWRRSL